MNEIIYGKNEDPWPYEYVINALYYFSMSPENRDKYIVNDFPDVLFHGNFGDFITGSAQYAITEIFTEIIRAGITFDDWIEDENLEDIGIENLFKELHTYLVSMKQRDIFLNWRDSQNMSLNILNKLGWTEITDFPDFSCKKLLDEWSYGEYSIKVAEKQA